MNLKYTYTGKYLIAAGCQRNGASDKISPLLFISLVGEKGWATAYPMEGSFAKDEDAAAAALHYGIELITRHFKDLPRPGEIAPASL